MVLHPPRFGATVASVDDQAALAEAGVTAVVPIDEGVAVVAETFADAQRGLRALWWSGTTRTPSAGAPRSCSRSTSGCSSRARSAVTARDDGDVDQALARRGLDGRRDLHAAVPRSRADGAEQRGMPDARGRRARGVGGNRGA